jgi:hypothetical protein
MLAVPLSRGDRPPLQKHTHQIWLQVNDYSDQNGSATGWYWINEEVSRFTIALFEGPTPSSLMPGSRQQHDHK